MLGIEVLLIVIAIMLGVTFVRMGTRGRPQGLTSRCLNCREIIPDSAKVCPVCRRDTEWHAARVGFFDAPCPHCEHVINRWAKVCPACGLAVNRR